MAIGRTTVSSTRRDLAGGHGVSTQRIRSASELQQALPVALRAEGTVLLDIQVA